MAYYFVDVSIASHGIGCLIGVSEAVIETLNNEDLFNSRIRVHLIDYKKCNESEIDFWSPGEYEQTWKVIRRLDSLPKPHKFKTGDRVKLNKNCKIPPSVSHVAEDIHNIDELTVSYPYYYSWGGVTYSVVGFRSPGYEAWCPEDILELVESDVSKSNDYGWKVGDWVYVKNHPASGIPYSLEGSELVQIVDPNVYLKQGGLNDHTHLIRFKDKVIGVSCIEGQFSLNHHYKDKGRWRVGDCPYASNNYAGNGLPLNVYTKVRIVDDVKSIFATGMLESNDWTHIVELVDYPGVYYRVNYKSADFRNQHPDEDVPLPEKPCSEEHYFESVTVSGTSATVVGNNFPYGTTTTTTISTYPQAPEECLEKKNGIQILKLQKPKTLKPKNHGNSIKLRKYCIS